MVEAIWEGVRGQLRADLLAKDFDTWIAPVRAIAWQNDELTIEVPSTFGLEWIRSHYIDVFGAALVAAAGRPSRLRFVVNRALEAAPVVKRSVLRAGPRPARLIRADPRCT